MNDFDSIIKRMTVTHVGPEDYTGEDGLLYCGKCRTSKPRFIVTREYSGSQSMRAAFEQAIESQACGQFESWLEKRESGKNAC